MNRSVKQWKKYGKEAAEPICWSSTTETWNDAIYYITGEKTEYSTSTEAKKGLMIRLEKNSQR